MIRSWLHPVLGAALLGIVVGTSGCNVFRITLDRPITPDDVAFIALGTTTLDEVVARLGSPDSMADSSRGAVVTYRFWDAKYARVNFGWLAKPWSPVDPDLILSRTGLGLDTLAIYCDADWVVTQWSFLRHLSGPRFNPVPF